jgi:small ligand-binding sensory domain FIST
VSQPRFAAAHAFAEDWREAADACLAALTLPQGANLGFLYFSDRYAAHAEALLARLREGSGIAHWVGSIGLGVCGAGTGALDAAGISVLVGRFPQDAFRVFSGRQRLGPIGAETPYFAVVHADPRTPDMPGLVADMAGKLASGFVTGGLSSARGEAIQIADGVLSGGISGVAFAESVRVATRLTQGCAPLAGHHRITACDGNVIESIDNRAALDVFREAAGESLARDLARAAQTVLVGLLAPGREDYVARHVIGVDPRSRMIAINETVEAGQGLLFCRRGGDAAATDMRRMLDELRASLPGPPQAALYFACVGRASNMFEKDASELEMIRASFGDLPLAGFFAAGEISHDRLYGYTGVLTLFL